MPEMYKCSRVSFRQDFVFNRVFYPEGVTIYSDQVEFHISSIGLYVSCWEEYIGLGIVESFALE